MLIALGAVLGVAVLAGVAIPALRGANQQQTVSISPVTGRIAAGDGPVLLQDTFTQSGSGWPTATLSSGTTFAVTASQDVGAPAGAGFGVICRTPADDLRFEFLLEVGEGWSVEEGTGQPSDTSAPTLLRQGSSPVFPGARPITVVGVCDAEAGGQSTRVAMFVDGLRTVDFVAPSPGAASGWLAGIDVASQSAASLTVVASHFVLRDTAPLSPVKS